MMFCCTRAKQLTRRACYVTAWDFPVFIIAAVAVAIVVTYGLIRVTAAARQPGYKCNVCGRKHDSVGAYEWRYCPHCGAPRAAKTTADLPKRK
jgi:DNA-directed RNA polymerase subunit RPC12/RpoP